MSRAMWDAKPRNGQRLALGLAGLAAVWLFGVWPPPVWWRSHWPRETAMMRLRSEAVSYQPLALGKVPPVLQRMVIIGEDSRFRTHHGIDFTELADALSGGSGGGGGAVRTLWQRRDRIRGASTITQQLAKNLYLSPSRSVLRKLKEAVTAVRLELALPKDRILELYLNLAEWGPGIWGADAASRYYFGVPVSQLDEEQAAALAATLPHPITSNPVFRPDRTLAQVAGELDVDKTHLGSWRRALEGAPSAAQDLTEREELRRLRRENARLKLEQEILKKAMAFFANDGR